MYTQAMEIRGNIETKAAYLRTYPHANASQTSQPISASYIALSPQFLYTLEHIADGDLKEKDNGSTLIQAIQ